MFLGECLGEKVTIIEILESESNQLTADDKLQVNVKEKNAIVTCMPAEIFPEYVLIRVNEFDKVGVTPMEEWMRYLKSGVIRPDTTAPGLEETREKLKFSNARKMKDKGLDYAMIADITGLNLEEIAKL